MIFPQFLPNSVKNNLKNLEYRDGQFQLKKNQEPYISQPQLPATVANPEDLLISNQATNSGASLPTMHQHPQIDMLSYTEHLNNNHSLYHKFKKLEQDMQQRESAEF